MSISSTVGLIRRTYSAGTHTTAEMIVPNDSITLRVAFDIPAYEYNDPGNEVSSKLLFYDTTRRDQNNLPLPPVWVYLIEARWQAALSTPGEPFYFEIYPSAMYRGMRIRAEAVLKTNTMVFGVDLQSLSEIE